jgi:hypothetical protein
MADRDLYPLRLYKQRYEGAVKLFDNGEIEKCIAEAKYSLRQVLAGAAQRHHDHECSLATRVYLPSKSSRTAPLSHARSTTGRMPTDTGLVLNRPTLRL